MHLAQTCDNAQGFAQLARRGRRRSWGSAGPHPECSCGVFAIPGRRGSSGSGGNPWPPWKDGLAVGSRGDLKNIGSSRLGFDIIAALCTSPG